MVREHRGEYPSLWAAIESIAPKNGMARVNAQTTMKVDVAKNN
jgi:predicted secreted Zn-dependent protease